VEQYNGSLPKKIEIFFTNIEVFNGKLEKTKKQIADLKI
jgi:hypothetical protein